MTAKIISLAALAFAAAALSSALAGPPGSPPPEVVQASDVEWSPLNPARGDKGPMAGALWGDRTGAGPSGFLVRFADGFSSPPHIHNITYRGVVIHGLVHNDDPKAQAMWLPTGSFWTQPKGEAHITAAIGAETVAYIEIDEGPYLVRPTSEAFASGERPINVDHSNFVWLDASDITWIDQAAASASGDGPQMAFLWGIPQPGQSSGSLVKLPAGFAGDIRSNGGPLRAVVIKGQPILSAKAGNEPLQPGSYFGSQDAAVHRVACGANADCILYVRAQGTFDIAY